MEDLWVFLRLRRPKHQQRVMAQGSLPGRGRVLLVAGVIDGDGGIDISGEGQRTTARPDRCFRRRWHNPGGFRTWWRRLHDDGDAELDNTHLMRMAGRFARRVKAWGAANAVPVIFCKSGERKRRIAEAYLAAHQVDIGVFLVLVAKAPAPVWKVARSTKTGAIVNIERRREYVNHYSFHSRVDRF